MPPQQLHVRGAPVGVEGYVLHLCRCPECKEAYKVLGATARESRIKSPFKPAHVHGTWSGFSNYGCRCDKCLSACRKTYTYAAGWRAENREYLNEKQRARRASKQ